MEIETITLWLKAFIPRIVEGGTVVPGHGQHSGKTMLASPGPVNACFLTDQREFDSDIHAHTRTHSEIEINVKNGVMVREYHKCDPTIQVDCETGEEICNKSATTDYMKFSDFEVKGDTISVKLEGSARNACLEIAHRPISPSLDYHGTITITRVAPHAALIAFEGKIETYPAFEMYASVNGGKPRAVFTAPVVPGATPLALSGGPARDVKRTIEVNLQNGT